MLQHPRLHAGYLNHRRAGDRHRGHIGRYRSQFRQRHLELAEWPNLIFKTSSGQCHDHHHLGTAAALSTRSSSITRRLRRQYQLTASLDATTGKLNLILDQPAASQTITNCGAFVAPRLRLVVLGISLWHCSRRRSDCRRGCRPVGHATLGGLVQSRSTRSLRITTTAQDSLLQRHQPAQRSDSLKLVFDETGSRPRRSRALPSILTVSADVAHIRHRLHDNVTTQPFCRPHTARVTLRRRPRPRRYRRSWQSSGLQQLNLSTCCRPFGQPDAADSNEERPTPALSTPSPDCPTSVLRCRSPTIRSQTFCSCCADRDETFRQTTTRGFGPPFFFILPFQLAHSTLVRLWRSVSRCCPCFETLAVPRRRAITPYGSLLSMRFFGFNTLALITEEPPTGRADARPMHRLRPSRRMGCNTDFDAGARSAVDVCLPLRTIFIAFLTIIFSKTTGIGTLPDRFIFC